MLFGLGSLLLIVGITVANAPQPGSARGLAVVALGVVYAAAWLRLGFSDDGVGPATALLSAMWLSGLGLDVLTRAGQVFPALFLTAAVAPQQLPPRRAGWVVVPAALVIGGYLVVRDGFDPVGAGLVVLGSGYFFHMARVRQLGEQALAQAQAAQAAEAAAAALDERARISRELHDVLAHSLAGLALQLEGTRLLARQQGASVDLQGQLDRATALAAAGLAEARAVVGSLRAAPPPGPRTLPDLVAAAEADLGVPVSLTTTGTAYPLAPAAAVALARTVQEALTNVRKHARPGRVDVALRWAAQEVVLRIEDRDGTAGVAGAGGYGLLGMRERAELAAGSLRAGPTATGWVVELRLPRETACCGKAECPGSAE